MSEQVGNQITFFWQYKALGAGKTGLTDLKINAWHVSKAGVKTQIVTDALTGYVELGYGVYYYTVSGTLTATEGDYIGVVHTDDATVDYQDLAHRWEVGRAGIEHLAAGCVIDGGGTIDFVYTVYSDVALTLPLEGVKIWLTSDLVGANTVAGPAFSDANGITRWKLPAGTYYIWRQKAGYTFTNPDTEVVA